MQPIDTETVAVGDWVVDTNWSVYGADLRKVGTVDDVQPDYLVVRKRRLFRRASYIPVSTIFNVERQCVYLNVSQKDIEDRGWDRIPDRQPSHSATPDTLSHTAGPTASGHVRQ